MSYIERATRIILEAGLPSTVLLSDDADVMCVFSPMFTGMLTPPPTEFVGRKLRRVDCFGRSGEQTEVVLKEPLDSSVMDAVSTAFDAYCDTVNSIENAELHRMFQRPDPRT